MTLMLTKFSIFRDPSRTSGVRWPKTTSENPLQSLQLGPMPPRMDLGKNKERKLKIWLEMLPNIIKRYHPQNVRSYTDTGNYTINTDYFESKFGSSGNVFQEFLQFFGIDSE